MNRASLASFVFVAALAPAQGVLQLDNPVQGRIEAGRVDSYALELRNGDYIEVIAEQTEVDLVLRLISPAGAQLQEVNDVRAGGTELLIHLAGGDGTYRLDVSSVLEGGNGRYILRLAAKRSPTPTDRIVASSEVRLRGLIEAKSPDSASLYEDLAKEFEAAGVLRRQASALVSAALLRNRRAEYDQALSDAERSVASWRVVKDRAGEAGSITVLGMIRSAQREYLKAAGYYEQALVIRNELNDRAAQAATLNQLGSTNYALHQYPKATDAHTQALNIARQIKDRASESDALLGLGEASLPSGQFARTVDYFEQALAIKRDLRDRAGESRALNQLAYGHFTLSHQDLAIGYFEQGLAIARELNDRRVEASALNGLGFVYTQVSQYEKAIVSLEQSLAICRELKDRSGESLAISNLGELYTSIGQYEKAISYQEQSLAITRSMKNRLDEGFNLGFLGRSYRLLGQGEKAIGYYEQALTIARDLKILIGEGMLLNELGGAYLVLNQYDTAIRYYEGALKIVRQVKNRAVEGWALHNLGNTHLRLNQAAKAIEYYDQALALARDVKDRAAEGEITTNLGLAYSSLRQPQRAIELGESALAISREVKNRPNEHDALYDLMLAYQGANQPRLAVFYGKQAVNVLQGIRSDIRGLSQESRTRFLESKAETYRALANLLVSLERLLEAQQVLKLLKEQEFFDYIRRNERAAGPSGRADLTAEEAEWADRYRRVSESLVAKGAEMEELRARFKKQPSVAASSESRQALDELQRDLEAGNRAFQQFLIELKQHFAAKPESGSTAIDLRDAEGLKADLADLKHGSVAIYTLLASDRYVAILVTPRVQRAYETKISAGELNTKILQFREAIEDPRSDPRPLAHELYRILIPEALASDLKQGRAETLMWSLDGPLRYVPISALYDGTQYLIEKYRIAVFTPASNARLKEVPQRIWRGVAFGVTAAHPGFDPLPGVAAELHSIIREKPGDPGVLQGHSLLDGQFTRAALDRELMAGFPVVHVASHFQFRPGDETRSFLLLGDGGQLTLADLKSADTIFAGVDLLTLSACSTGLGGARSSDGSEVEGFGVLAQRKGAKSVIASLWPVADGSTGLLMREFYRSRQSEPTMTKIEALRRAQLRLMHGDASADNASPPRTLKAVGQAPVSGDYRHPFYWAPFFLMGNWL